MDWLYTGNIEFNFSHWQETSTDDTALFGGFVFGTSDNCWVLSSLACVQVHNLY